MAQYHERGGVDREMLNTAMQEGPEQQSPQADQLSGIDSEDVESMTQRGIDDLHSPENPGKGEDIDCAILPGISLLTRHL